MINDWVLTKWEEVDKHHAWYSLFDNPVQSLSKDRDEDIIIRNNIQAVCDSDKSCVCLATKNEIKLVTRSIGVCRCIPQDMLFKIFRSTKEVFEKPSGAVHLELAVYTDCLRIQYLRNEAAVFAEAIPIGHRNYVVPFYSFIVSS